MRAEQQAGSVCLLVDGRISQAPTRNAATISSPSPPPRLVYFMFVLHSSISFTPLSHHGSTPLLVHFLGYVDSHPNEEAPGHSGQRFQRPDWAAPPSLRATTMPRNRLRTPSMQTLSRCPLLQQQAPDYPRSRASTRLQRDQAGAHRSRQRRGAHPKLDAGLHNDSQLLWCQYLLGNVDLTRVPLCAAQTGKEASSTGGYARRPPGGR